MQRLVVIKQEEGSKFCYVDSLFDMHTECFYGNQPAVDAQKKLL